MTDKELIRKLDAELVELHREVERLRAENEALRADAERYRWLRDTPYPNEEFAYIIALQRNAIWDAAIDAAMKDKP